MCAAGRIQGQTSLLSDTEIAETIDSLCVALEKNYFDTVICKGLIFELKERFQNGVFNETKLPIQFETTLDNIIRGYTKDDHFKVIFDPKWVQENSLVKTAEEYQNLLSIEKEESKKINYGFREVSMLGGGIGYLKLTSFENPEFSANTLASAMSFLANSKALIIDLRNNSGGYTEMMALLCSYFLNTSEDWYLPLTEMKLMKEGNEIIIQNNAVGGVVGPKMLNQKLYILTNYRTFSAGEWTAFILKNRKRALIVGEKTAGGTHPTTQAAISKSFYVNIPIGTMTDVLTHNHFEGVGVIPDIETSAVEALIRAQIHYWENLPDTSGDEHFRDWHLSYLKSLLSPVSIPAEILRSYQGQFGNIELRMIGDKLFSIREDIKTDLIPITETLLRLNGRDDMRFRIIEEHGRIVAIEKLFENGTALRSNKN